MPIIDGIEVEGCIYYGKGKVVDCGMFALGDFKCKGQICLYKQNKKLEKENEQLKELKNVYLTCYKEKHSDIKGELFKLRKENERLKERVRTEELIIKKYKEISEGSHDVRVPSANLTMLLYKSTLEKIIKVIDEYCRDCDIDRRFNTYEKCDNCIKGTIGRMVYKALNGK